MRRVRRVAMATTVLWALAVLLDRRAQRAQTELRARQVSRVLRDLPGPRVPLDLVARQDQLDPQVWRDRAARWGIQALPDQQGHLAPPAGPASIWKSSPSTNGSP